MPGLTGFHRHPQPALPLVEHRRQQRKLARHLALTIGGRHHITQNKAKITNVALIYSRVLTIERLNKEIKRRTDVVGVFPNPAALLRLAGSVLVEAHDEWQVADKRYLSETTLALLNSSDEPAQSVAPAPALTA